MGVGAVFGAAARYAHDVLELLPKVLVQPAVQDRVGAGRGHAHHVAEGVADAHRLRREVGRHRQIGDQVEQIHREPADAEDDGYRY